MPDLLPITLSFYYHAILHYTWAGTCFGASFSACTYLFIFLTCACLTAFNLCLSLAHYLSVYLSFFKPFFIISPLLFIFYRLAYCFCFCTALMFSPKTRYSMKNNFSTIEQFETNSSAPKFGNLSSF